MLSVMTEYVVTSIHRNFACLSLPLKSQAFQSQLDSINSVAIGCGNKYEID